MSSAVVEHEPTDQGPADPQEQLDGLGCLHHADHPRQDAQHAPLGAVGHEVRRRRLGIKAAIARPVRREEDRRLAVEPEDRAVDVRLAQEHARVVDQVAGREVVSPVHDHVVFGENLQRVATIDRMLVADDVQVGVDGLQLLLGAGDLGPADVGREVDDLALEVRDVDDVEIDQPDRANPGRGQVERQRRAQPAGADAEDLRSLEPLLPLHRHLGHDQVAGIALDFGG